MALAGDRSLAKNRRWFFHGIRREMEKYLVAPEDNGRRICPRISSRLTYREIAFDPEKESGSSPIFGFPPDPLPRPTRKGVHPSLNGYTCPHLQIHHGWPGVSSPGGKNGFNRREHGGRRVECFLQSQRSLR